jgi:hypothetical protein
MVALGLILMIIGFAAKIPILWTVGLVLLVIGAVQFVAGRAGHELAGRKHWH